MVKKAYIIAGPTASGKSGFAHLLAKRVKGTIINADSVQVYRGIENVSSSPLADNNLENVPYKLYSIQDLDSVMNVADWLELAKKEYEAAEVPIFVGGSGYYINALLNGISPIPKVSDENRERARRMIADAPDEARALVDFKFNDPQRMARALEVFLETGKPITEWQNLPKIGAIHTRPTCILIMPPRDILSKRIRERLSVMLDGGAMDEARRYADRAHRAIGLEEIGRYLQGECSEDQMIERWAIRTDQYAKRQRTWFNNQFPADITITRIPTDEDLENVFCK